MHQRAGHWLVYDVAVEGVSLVGNYRDQFNSIIRTSSYPELVRRTRARVDALKGSAGPVALGEPLIRLASAGGLPWRNHSR
jgi:phospholipid transport system substrate-binding protein